MMMAIRPYWLRSRSYRAGARSILRLAWRIYFGIVWDWYWNSVPFRFVAAATGKLIRVHLILVLCVQDREWRKERQDA